MDLKKVFWVELLIVILALSFVGPAFSQKKPGKTVAHAGKIEWVSRDFKYIGISEHKVSILPGTKIVDKQGNPLTVGDLKPGRVVVVEIMQSSGGSHEKRIVIRK